MALGTVASRGTGFLRTIAITAAIGTHSVGDAYNVANTTPNIIYDLLLGGVLTSVVVPVLVRASKEDEDGGERLRQLAADRRRPGPGRLHRSSGSSSRRSSRGSTSPTRRRFPLATTFMRWFLPQIVFYGIGATIGAILNIRGRFGAPMVTPVLNNLVVIAIAIIFIFLPGPQPADARRADDDADLGARRRHDAGRRCHDAGSAARRYAPADFATVRGSTCAIPGFARPSASAAGCSSTSPPASSATSWSPGWPPDRSRSPPTPTPTSSSSSRTRSSRSR